MKVTVEYASAEEKAKFLSNVVYLLKEKPKGIEEVADAFVQHLMLVAKDAYVQGGIRKEAEAKGKELSAEADGLFGAAGGDGPEKSGADAAK